MQDGSYQSLQSSLNVTLNIYSKNQSAQQKGQLAKIPRVSVVQEALNQGNSDIYGPLKAHKQDSAVRMQQNPSSNLSILSPLAHMQNHHT